MQPKYYKKTFFFWLTLSPKYVIINYAPDGRNSGYPQSYPQGKNNQKKFTLGVDFWINRSYTIRTIRDIGLVQKAGNVKQEGQIPEFNTLPMPEGSGSKKIQQNQEVTRSNPNDTNRHTPPHQKSQQFQTLTPNERNRATSSLQFL
jgi:hypothetical protein